MKKMAKAAALLAAITLTAGLTACQGKGLVIDGAEIKGFTPDVPAKLVIPKDVTRIGKGAFENCLTLESVTIPDNVMNIDVSAFYHCKNLKSVTIGNGISYIYGRTFLACTSLTSVTILGNLEEISNGAFRDCTNLTEVSLPVSVTRIDDTAFDGCSLKTINYGGTKEQWWKVKKPAFYGVTVKCTDGDVLPH